MPTINLTDSEHKSQRGHIPSGRDLPVLAETALKITADRSDGKRLRPWEKVIERFFLDGVDVLGNEFSIGMGIEITAFIFPDVADTEFPIGNPTMVAAQEAGNLIAFHFFIKHRFFEQSLSPLYRLNCITSIPSTFYSHNAKYSIFYNKIQDLPYILCNDFLYYYEKKEEAIEQIDQNVEN